MIVVTGATGLVGSCLIHKLNAEHFKAIVAVDESERLSKSKSLQNASIQESLTWNNFMQWLDRCQSTVEFIFHMGMPATHRTCPDSSIPHEINAKYAMSLWQRCADCQIPLVYTSSAAIYGEGENGFREAIAPDKLKPLSKPGMCYLNFDKWVSKQQKAPFYWAGLRLFTVYGPNECRQEGPVSPVYHAIEQLATTGTAKLYKTHHSNCKDEEQSRDFIHVQDVVNGCYFMMHHRKHSGFYNMGSGRARSFLDLVKIVCQQLGKKGTIEFIDRPIDSGCSYPHFMEASTDKLIKIGLKPSFYTLEEGVRDCIKNHSDGLTQHCQ